MAFYLIMHNIFARRCFFKTAFTVYFQQCFNELTYIAKHCRSDLDLIWLDIGSFSLCCIQLTLNPFVTNNTSGYRIDFCFCFSVDRLIVLCYHYPFVCVVTLQMYPITRGKPHVHEVIWW